MQVSFTGQVSIFGLSIGRCELVIIGCFVSNGGPDCPYKFITDQQVRLYMTDRNTHSQYTAAARAVFSERTARRLDADPTLPSQREAKRGRTVADPLDGVWEKLLLPILVQDSSVQAITLLCHLQQKHPEGFQDARMGSASYTEFRILSTSGVSETLCMRLSPCGFDG